MNLKKIFCLAVSVPALVIGGYASADSASGVITIDGTAISSCSVGAANLSLGSTDLWAYRKTFDGGTESFMEIPIDLVVSCTSSIPWKVYNPSASGVPMTIGSVSDNRACVQQPTANGSGLNCAVQGGESWNVIADTGSKTKRVGVAIWHSSPQGVAAAQGSGAISATIPLTIEF